MGTDQDLKYVYVVEQDHKVVRHTVKLGSLQDGLQVITEGVEPGDQIIVRDIQRMQQGATVNPKLVPMPELKQGTLPPTPVLKTPPPSAKKG